MTNKLGLNHGCGKSMETRSMTRRIVRRVEKEAELKYKKDRMMHGKKKVGHSKDSPTYKQFVARAKESKLKRGEVKTYDKAKQKWVSNKD